MADETLLGPPAIRRRLSQLSHRELNFDLAALSSVSPASGWQVIDMWQPLPGEPPGMPVPDGSWEIARRLMRAYKFADPSIVRAYYDPEVPLEERNMLLRLQALRLVRVFVGVRVGAVYEHTRVLDGRRARVWGWNYHTLEGHLEMGQMDWEVWKWLESGEVEFHVHSVSRTARIANPLVRVGFWLLKGHERDVFLSGARNRMRTFIELTLEQQGPKKPASSSYAR
jgi:uncharacterized protein (UPF0548 family)